MRSQEFKSTYVIVSPVRNEGEYLEATIEAVSKQTILPVEWVIVNDGSTDKTREIIDSAAARYPWIRAVHRPDRGYRKAGGGVIEAFNDGFSALSVTDWAFLVKLDGDLTFENNYFEKCFREFDADKSLGIG